MNFLQNVGHNLPGDYHLGNSFISKYPFNVPKEQLSNHYLITGATRRGKSYFTSILASYLAKDSAVVLLDPHGTLAEQVLDNILLDPDIDQDRIVYWDVNSTDYTIGYNPLKRNESINLSKQVNILMDACLRVWGQDSFNETPTLYRWLYNGFSILIQTEKTFVDAEHLFSLNPNESRNLILSEAKAKIKNDESISAFESIMNDNLQSITNEFDWLLKQSPRILRDEILSSHNRIFPFLQDPNIKAILGQKDGIDLRRIMDEKKILLVNLVHDRISEDASRILALMMANELFHLSFSRKEKNDCFVIADEFTEITTKSIEKAVKQTGKFKVWWILITQYMAQIREFDPVVLDGLLSSCQNKISFGGMTIRDCEIIAEDIFAGALNLQEVKLEKIVQRAELQWMDIISESTSNSSSKSTSTGESKSVTQSRQHSESNGWGKAKGLSEGNSKFDSWSDAKFRAIMEGQSKFKGVGSATGQSDGSASGNSNSWGDGAAFNSGHNLRSPFQVHAGSNWGSNFSSNHGLSQSASHSENRFSSDSKSEGEGKNKGESKGESTGKSGGSANMKSEMESTSQNGSISDAEGIANSSAMSHQNSNSTSQQTGRSVTRTPVTVYKEEKEIAQFWSMEEQAYKLVSLVKLLGVGVAAMKLGNNPPDVVKIKTVPKAMFEENMIELRKGVLTAGEWSIPFNDALENIRSTKQIAQANYSEQTMPNVSTNDQRDDDDSFGL